MKTVWIVEEISSETGKTIFHEYFQNYEEANEMYNERKGKTEDNFVSMYLSIDRRQL